MKSRYLLAILLAVCLSLMSWVVWAQEGEGTTTKEAPPPPDVITLDQISPDPEFGNFYGPVELNHLMHEGFGCEQCHHFFDKHMLPGIILESEHSDANCQGCHHMDSEPYDEPMNCYLCHQQGELDTFLSVKGNLPCWFCHETEMQMIPRVLEIEDPPGSGTMVLYNPPTQRAVYHQNCLECHKTFGASTECTFCHEAKTSTK